VAGGATASGNRLEADVKFAELVAEIVGSIRKLKHLERQQAGLRQFLPPAILAAIGSDSDPALLAPRESIVTVMFCDLRGFSRRVETARDDLIGLLDRVSQALGVMTRHISAHGGVIGDFQGDAAMGFWGWPVPSDDDPLRACRAALAIRAEFAAAAGTPGNPLADFRMGIGLARGKGVSGRIGTPEHFVFTAFGPVVNLASRLEGMTKHLHVPIVIDENLLQIVRAGLSAEEGRTRLLGKVLPYGTETPVTVAELLPGERELPELTAANLADYDAAVSDFIAGRWDEAHAALRTLPAGDRAQDFLAGQIVAHNRQPPADWNGVVKLPSK
jgi:adenylate cyclase